MAGIADASTGTLLSVDKQISGEFQYCSNANGLGAELYLNAGDDMDSILGRIELAGGRIIKSGPKELALELEAKGYDWVKEHA